MRVFVTGGTGAIGGYAVPALTGAGYSVTALARSDAKADVLGAQGATPLRVSLFDRDALKAAFANHDAVVNLATALPSTATFIFRFDLASMTRSLRVSNTPFLSVTTWKPQYPRVQEGYRAMANARK